VAVATRGALTRHPSRLQHLRLHRARASRARSGARRRTRARRRSCRRARRRQCRWAGGGSKGRSPGRGLTSGIGASEHLVADNAGKPAIDAYGENVVILASYEHEDEAGGD